MQILQNKRQIGDVFRTQVHRRSACHVASSLRSPRSHIEEHGYESLVQVLKSAAEIKVVVKFL